LKGIFLFINIFRTRTLTGLLLSVILVLQGTGILQSRDFIIKGTVTERSGLSIPNAKISIVSGSAVFEAVSEYNGTYTLRISGIYDDNARQFQQGIAFPAPFTYSVNIPFIITVPGDIRFAVYNLSGQKITDNLYPSVDAGSYRIIWDGCNENGSPVRAGLYIYAITFQGRTWSGRLLKAYGFSSFSAGNALQSVTVETPSIPSSGTLRIKTVTSVTCQSYYPVRLTDITIGRDTIIDFELDRVQAIPYKASGDYIMMHTGSDYRPLLLKGINLGSSPPGYFPGEIAYSIKPEMYEQWIKRIAQAGFNCIRVYTLHPPVFYEKLADYNERHKDKPLLLFQGIWLEEVSDPSNPDDYDLTLRTNAFTSEVREVIDCIHGNRDIGFRPGKAYGNYLSDVSRWTAGYILGREIAPQEVDSTNHFHPLMTSYSGYQFSITEATATEVFVTRMLDESVSYETGDYSVSRPVSISSWPTLDPLIHPTEIYTDEDVASIDIEKINGKNQQAGLFACYHAYPYYPDFISQQPSYRTYSDAEGPDSYLGYITDLRTHYSGIPLVIGEFGVPSSWGSAHQSFSNMNHGGYSEIQQGQKNIRLLHNIFDAACAGGFMFSWMDEWFKPTWIVGYLEAFGFESDGVIIPTRQLWHNLVSSEQNFGMLAFDQSTVLPYISYQLDNTSGPVNKISVTSDNSYFYLDIENKEDIIQGDTMMIAFDTYSGGTGESKLPNTKSLGNRSEFLLSLVFGSDTSSYQVTEAYDMNGLTPRFDLTDPAVQKYRSTVTDGAPWNEMEWINNGFLLTTDHIGRLPMENSAGFTPGERTAVAWYGKHTKVRIPWTMLYFYDPTQSEVIDGAYSDDGGWTFNIIKTVSDGIAVSVYCKDEVVSSTTRYIWQPWLVVPSTDIREKESLHVVESDLVDLPMFAN
jgi:hypothetical protein